MEKTLQRGSQVETESFHHSPEEKKSAAQILANSYEKILKIWEQRVRAQLPSAAYESRISLRDSLPEILKNLQKALETGFQERQPDLVRCTHDHGVDRAVCSHFSIEEALQEYHILRNVIFEVLEESGPLSNRDRDVICDLINYGQVQVGAQIANFQIEKQKKFRLEASKLAAHLELITDAQPTLISYVDRNYTYQFANQTYAKWFHLDKNQIAGRRMVDVIGEKAFAMVRPKIDEAFVGIPASLETELPYKSGTRFIKGTYLPDFHENGTIRGVFVSVSDITDLKAAERALRESEENFRAFAEAMPQIAFIADGKGNVFYYNQRHFDYFGVRPGETEAWAWAEKQIHHPDDLERTIATWKKALETGEPYEIEYRLRRYDGTFRWHLGRALPQRDSSGTIVRWFGTNTDIQGQKEAEAEHKKLIEKLQAERDLREQFVNTLTHDLRTPLAAIQMATQMIQSRVRDPQLMKELTGRILSNVHRSDRMIQDLLDANRVKAGQGMRIDIQEMNMEKVVSATISDLEGIYGKRFSLQATGELQGYWCPSATRRLLENMASNAVKYGSPNKPIEIRLEDLKNQVRLSVHNHGNPMSQDEVSTLFSPFRRAKAADASAIKGWGMGLTIVRGIAEAHCGKITVESSQEAGTTFTLTLPKDSRPCLHDRFSDQVQGV
jgi:PAS domain S-box-containing protein